MPIYLLETKVIGYHGHGQVDPFDGREASHVGEAGHAHHNYDPESTRKSFKFYTV